MGKIFCANPTIGVWMILTLVILALFLSCICTFVLKQQIAGFFLVLISTFHVVNVANSNLILFFVCITTFIQSMNLFISQKKNTLLWLIIFLSVGYSTAILIFKPYEIHGLCFVFFFESLLFFIWATLIKWDAEKIISIATALGIYLLLIGFAEWLLINPKRIMGPLSVATSYGVVLVLAWSIWFVESYFSKRFSYSVMFLGTLFVSAAVLLSGTRMGIIGIVMGILLGVAFNAWASKLRNSMLFQKIFYTAFILCCTSLLIFAIWSLIPNEVYVKRALDNVIAGKIDLSNMGRIISWVAALNTIQENQIWGIGPGNFSIGYKATLQSLANTGIPHPTQILLHSHNLYLMILSEYGFSGFFIFGLIVIACFMQLFLCLKNSNSVGIYYALLSCGIIAMTLGMVDIIPFDWHSLGLAAWYMGILASFSLTRSKEIAK